MTSIKLDINSACFQQDFFSLEKIEQLALLKTLKKVAQLTWQQLYQDQGLKWEAIISKKSERIYSFRFSQKYRATALRQNDFLRLIALHVDHNSAYKI